MVIACALRLDWVKWFRITYFSNENMLLCFVDRRKKRRKDRKTTHATAQATAHATAHATRYSTRKNTRFKTRKNTQATTDSQSQHKSQRDICPPRFFCSVHLHVCCRRYEGGWEKGRRYTLI